MLQGCRKTIGTLGAATHADEVSRILKPLLGLGPAVLKV